MKSGTKVSVRITLPPRTIEWMERKREELGWSDEQVMTEVIKKGVGRWRGEKQEF
jgi:hypothetical protein